MARDSLLIEVRLTGMWRGEHVNIIPSAQSAATTSAEGAATAIDGSRAPTPLPTSRTRARVC